MKLGGVGARGAFYYYNSNVYYFGRHKILSLALAKFLLYDLEEERKS